MIEVIPAILTDNAEELHEMLSEAQGAAKKIHIDIIDGKFAQNHTIDPSMLNNAETDLEIDFHLMVGDPAKWIKKCITAGAIRIIGQIEQMPDQEGFANEVHNEGCQVGLALDLVTPLSQLTPGVLAVLDVILVMAVPAGFGGQEFDRSVFEKIKELDKIRKEQNYFYSICVDGGVTEELAKELIESGVNSVVVGKRLFKGDIMSNIQTIIDATNES